MDAEDCEDSSGLAPFRPAAHNEHRVDDCAVSVEQTPMAGPRKRKFGASSLGQRKKWQSEGASKLVSSMENLASLVKSQQREVRVHHDYPHSTPELIGKCLAKVYSLNSLGPNNPLIDFAVFLMDNLANQAIMLQIPTDDTVSRWLRVK